MDLTNKLLAVKYDISGPGLSPTTNVEATSMFEKLVSQLIGVLTIFAVVYFVIQVILAGYGLISTNGDEKKLEVNRDKLIYGVLGIFVVIIAVGMASLVSKLLGLNNPLDFELMFKNMGL